ncbi:MAG: CAP domain-containing protein [Oscillospiraceae bacterium]|jgi:uncharacterized protein YkwD|nr:CAP domain-containing protein [Oscillospiraceae bacterium]
MKQTITKWGALLLALALLCTALALPVAAAVPANYATDVVALVNSERAKAGLGALAGNNQALNNAAQKRATEIVTKFAHERPDGSSCFTVLEDYGVSYVTCGENIAYGYSTAAAVMEGWMNSSGHKANILHTSFTHIGVGVVESGGTIYCVQLFTGDGSGSGGSTNTNNTASLSLWDRIYKFFVDVLAWFLRPFVIFD